MKIVHVYFGWGQTGYRPGWQRFDIITEELAKAGNQVYIIGLAYRWRSWRDRLLGKVERKSSATDLIPPRPLATLDVILGKLGFLDGLAQALMLLSLTLKIKPQVVILQDEPVGFDFWFLLFKRLADLRFRVIVDYQDLIVRLVTYGQGKSLKRSTGIVLNEIVVPSLADALIVITNFGKMYLSSMFPHKPIHIVRELVDPERFAVIDEQLVINQRKEFNIKESDNVLFWIGHIGAGRSLTGLMVLFKAMSLAEVENLKLLLVGGAPSNLVLQLKGLAEKLNISVLFTGFVKRSSPRHIAFYHVGKVGVFVLPEDLFTHFIAGMKVAEYLAAGLPVIAPDLKGVSEVVKGNGLLYKPGDVEDLASKIEQIFKMNLDELGKKSKQIANEILSAQAFRQNTRAYSSEACT